MTNNPSRTLKALPVFILFIIPFLSFGQTKDELEKKRNKVEKEIAFTKKLISETDEKQKQTLNYLAVLEKQIKSRETLLKTIKNEIRILVASIDQNQAVITALENDLENLKDEYAKMVLFAYKTRSTSNKLGFIFSAENFNQAYKRLKFLEYYSNYRKTQIDLIRKTQESLQGKVALLESQRKEKENLLEKQRKEKESLELDMNERKIIIQQLEEREDELRKELKKQEKEAEEFAKAIASIIERNKSKGLNASPEMQLISTEFVKNKNRLPWPVKEGVIVARYGRMGYTGNRGGVINNRGVNFRTEKDASVRAIFDGQVRSIIDVPGKGFAVIILHGDYFSVYRGLYDVYVKPNQNVKAKEVIGNVYTNPATGEAEVQLQIWKDTDTLDPEDWLAK